MRHLSFLLGTLLLLNLHVKAQELTVSFTSVPVTCADMCNATIDVTVAGGTGPYSYEWNSGQTTEDVMNLCAGTYVVLVIDAVGDSMEGQVSILAPAPLVVTVENDTVCPGSMGVLTAIVTGTTDVFICNWGNGGTGTSVQSMPGIETVVVTDANGCSASGFGGVIELQTMTLQIEVTDASCAGSDGSVTLSVNGGLPPYTYHLAGNPTPQNVFNNLSSGYYMLGVIDAENCMVDSSITLNEGGLTATIVSDSLDPCLSPVTLTAVPDGGVAPYTYTWNTGANTEAITMTAAGTSTVTITDDNGCTATAGTYAYVPDGTMSSYILAQLRRGFCDNLSARVRNFSCTAYTGPVSVVLDYDLTYDSAIPAPDDVNGNTLTWNNVTIAPGEQFIANIEVCVPLSLSCGDFLDVAIIIDAATFEHEAFVFCSFDPNDKQVSPIGLGDDGVVVFTQPLTYTIRFQNTGTIAAEFIHIIDTLDTDLNISSLRVLGSSHPMELRITEGNILDFFFDQINLPDSTSDLEGSQGFVIYTVDIMNDLQNGTYITNTAHIIFDFNEPVITNTTLNMAAEWIGIEEITASTPLSIHPNPSNGRFTITPLGEVEGLATLTLFDVAGRIVFTQTWSASEDATLVLDKQLDNGMYMLSITAADGHQFSSRVVIAN
jgi:uncharacterized repeat protein (TIGR01451 family)